MTAVTTYGAERIKFRDQTRYQRTPVREDKRKPRSRKVRLFALFASHFAIALHFAHVHTSLLLLRNIIISLLVLAPAGRDGEGGTGPMCHISIPRLTCTGMQDSCGYPWRTILYRHFERTLLYDIIIIMVAGTIRALNNYNICYSLFYTQLHGAVYRNFCVKHIYIGATRFCNISDSSL